MTDRQTRATDSNRFLGFDHRYLISEWKEIFNSKTVVSDAWAGVTVALVALPLNLALAIAAGVEPGIGITTGIVAGIIASVLGGQKYGVTGPAAAMAVVLIGVAETYGLQAIWLVGIIGGALQIAAGYFRLGKLISYIPMPVIVGFANAIGILVISNSLSDFLGVPKGVAHASPPAPAASHPYIPEFLEDIVILVSRVVLHGEINHFAVVTGMVVLLLAIMVPKLTKAVPSQLVAIVVASLLASCLGFHLPKIIDISTIPASLPLPHCPELPWGQLGTLFPVAITVFMLGSIESLLSASVADGMTMSKRHHSDQELIGQGVANIVIPFFGGIPVTGVIARTAVNIRAGAKTRLSGIIHSLTLLILVLVFAKSAEQIPLAALSGILILTGFRLIEWDATKQIWHASRTEGYVVLVTTAISVLIDLTAGVFTGLLMTCALFIRQISAGIVVPEEAQDRRSNVRQPFPSCKYVRTFLIDGPLFFGAAERFTETILLTQNLKTVVLHMKAVSVMDLTGAETILSIHSQLKRNSIRLCLTELPRQPLELLKRTGAIEKLGSENLFKDYGKCLLDVNAKLLESSCFDCRALITAPPQTKITAPSDCPLRSGIVLNTNHITSLLKNRLDGSKDGENGSNNSGLDGSRLTSIRSEKQIPQFLIGTPIHSLLKSQNLLEVDETPSEKADLVIGMCMDFRKQLHLPKNCAYVLRRAGANMKDCEFELALAVSAGIEYMALIAHNKCLMSNPYAEEQAVLETLSSRCGWKADHAQSFFDEQASARGISDPIQFLLAESERISFLFRGLKVIPLLYSVDDDKLYLLSEWLNQTKYQRN